MSDALDTAAAQITRDQVACVLMRGPVARTLIDVSTDAAMLALGTGGAGPMARVLLAR